MSERHWEGRRNKYPVELLFSESIGPKKRAIFLLVSLGALKIRQKASNHSCYPIQSDVFTVAVI